MATRMSAIGTRLGRRLFHSLCLAVCRRGSVDGLLAVQRDACALPIERISKIGHSPDRVGDGEAVMQLALSVVIHYSFSGRRNVGLDRDSSRRAGGC